MSMEIEGKVFKIMPEQSGEGKNGTWIKQEFVIETEGQFPKKVCFNCWGDKTRDVKQLTEGETIKVSFDPSSREFNDKWYTDLRAWRIEKMGGSVQTPTNTESTTAETTPQIDDLPPLPEEGNDLPF